MFKVIMQGKLFQKCTHLLFCSVLSLGVNVNTRRISHPDMGSIFHIKYTLADVKLFWPLKLGSIALILKLGSIALILKLGSITLILKLGSIALILKLGTLALILKLGSLALILKLGSIAL